MPNAPYSYSSRNPNRGSASRSALASGPHGFQGYLAALGTTPDYGGLPAAHSASGSREASAQYGGYNRRGDTPLSLNRPGPDQMASVLAAGNQWGGKNPNQARALQLMGMAVPGPPVVGIGGGLVNFFGGMQKGQSALAALGLAPQMASPATNFVNTAMAPLAPGAGEAGNVQPNVQQAALDRRRPQAGAQQAPKFDQHAAAPKPWADTPLPWAKERTVIQPRPRPQTIQPVPRVQPLPPGPPVRRVQPIRPIRPISSFQRPPVGGGGP